jgi:hypothetical protein
MSAGDDGRNETFFSRWSRVKTQARDSAATAPAPVAPPQAESDEPPNLPPVEELTLDSDFRGFFHPKVDEDLRRSALRKLFSDPHFNVMDGLDVYIDDYSKTEPIPAAMLASLKQAQRIFEWAAEDKEKTAEAASIPLAESAQPPAIEASAEPSVSSFTDATAGDVLPSQLT